MELISAQNLKEITAAARIRVAKEDMENTLAWMEEIDLNQLLASVADTGEDCVVINLSLCPSPDTFVKLLTEKGFQTSSYENRFGQPVQITIYWD